MSQQQLGEVEREGSVAVVNRELPLLRPFVSCVPPKMEIVARRQDQGVKRVALARVLEAGKNRLRRAGQGFDRCPAGKKDLGVLAFSESSLR